MENILVNYAWPPITAKAGFVAYPIRLYVRGEATCKGAARIKFRRELAVVRAPKSAQEDDKVARLGASAAWRTTMELAYRRGCLGCWKGAFGAPK